MDLQFYAFVAARTPNVMSTISCNNAIQPQNRTSRVCSGEFHLPPNGRATQRGRTARSSIYAARGAREMRRRQKRCNTRSCTSKRHIQPTMALPQTLLTSQIVAVFASPVDRQCASAQPDGQEPHFDFSARAPSMRSRSIASSRKPARMAVSTLWSKAHADLGPHRQPANKPRTAWASLDGGWPSRSWRADPACGQAETLPFLSRSPVDTVRGS